MKTGGQNTPWIPIPPKPPRVDNPDLYWVDQPPEPSERARYWVEQIERGWRPNKHIRRHCNQCSADWYGVYIWEYDHLIAPRLRQAKETA